MFYSFNQLTVYRYVFLLEFLVAEILFFRNLKRRKNFILRLVICLLVSSTLIWFFPIFKYEPFNISLLFIFIFVINVLSCKILFDEKWQTILFCAIASYTIQHISYQIYNFIVDNLYLGKVMDYLIETNPYYANNQKEGVGYSIVTLIVYLWSYFTVYWISGRTFASKIKKGTNITINHYSLILISMVIIFVDIYFNMLTVFYNTSSLFALLENIYNILSCLLALFLQFSQLTVTEVKGELDTIKSLWAERNKQYEMAKKNIEIINIKCHDLKHQIHRIRKNEHIDGQELKEIEKSLKIYDSNVKTGNEALDIILTEKALLCERNNIELTMIIDGKLLNFLSPRDIYSLFGNALDNAIEALEDIPENNRSISIIVKKKLNFISIHIENFLEKEIIIEDDRPKTSKEDASLHGFGFISMKEIVERYKGTITYETKNNTFSLNVILPSNS